MGDRPTIAVLGASGLIGQAVASSLLRDGFSVVAIARQFTSAQRNEFGDTAFERPIMALEGDQLAKLLAEAQVDVVVNCVGVLQDTAAGRTAEVHGAFVAKLLKAIGGLPTPMLVIHLSIPGSEDEDRTAYSRTKRGAERLIAASGAPFIILRPGFVVAPAAFGGSALIRSLAALPFDLPSRESQRPFAAVDVADVARTIAFAVRKWRGGEKQWAVVWDVMERNPGSVGDVVEKFRQRFGGPGAVLRPPSWSMDVGAMAGDLAAYLGWAPPIRSTAVAEMRRGVTGDPEAWIAATGIEPLSLEQVLDRLPATVQETWFAQLYLLKALVIASLVVFWVASGLIALTVAFDAATEILLTHGIPPRLAPALTVASSLLDISVGTAIAFRKTCRAGLLVGIVVSFGYLLGAAVIAPDLWVEPLGALVKTVPAMVLMLVALAILPNR